MNAEEHTRIAAGEGENLPPAPRPTAAAPGEAGPEEVLDPDAGPASAPHPAPER